jgi:hypothetical protein
MCEIVYVLFTNVEIHEMSEDTVDYLILLELERTRRTKPENAVVRITVAGTFL